ncbi:hypothetical protein D9M71_454890 [compost metagenome]
MPGAGQPAVDHLAHGVVPGGDVLADLLAHVACQFRPVTRGTTIAVLVVEEVVVGHGTGMDFGRCRQRGIPGQRCRRGISLAAALVRLCPCAVDGGEHLLALCLPVAQAPGQQRARQHDAPLAGIAAHADVDELRVEHHLAKALLYRLHGRLGVAWPVEADGLHVDHRVARCRQRLLQVTDAAG